MRSLHVLIVAESTQISSSPLLQQFIETARTAREAALHSFDRVDRGFRQVLDKYATDFTVVLYHTDPRNPPEAVTALVKRASRVAVSFSSEVTSGSSFARWLHTGSATILLPAMARKHRLRGRIEWLFSEGSRDPEAAHLSALNPLAPESGAVYLSLPYRRKHMDTCVGWVQPMLEGFGYTVYFTGDWFGKSIPDEILKQVSESFLILAHIGGDKAHAIHNPQVYFEMGAGAALGKLVVPFRLTRDRNVILPFAASHLNCMHAGSKAHLAQQLYKMIVRARQPALTHSGSASP